jgi:hypothetical protein
MLAKYVTVWILLTPILSSSLLFYSILSASRTANVPNNRPEQMVHFCCSDHPILHYWCILTAEALLKLSNLLPSLYTFSCLSLFYLTFHYPASALLLTSPIMSCHIMSCLSCSAFTARRKVWRGIRSCHWIRREGRTGHGQEERNLCFLPE